MRISGVFLMRTSGALRKILGALLMRTSGAAQRKTSEKLWRRTLDFLTILDLLLRSLGAHLMILELIVLLRILVAQKVASLILESVMWEVFLREDLCLIQN